ncbi:MAG: tetratricopeptide repeat protein [Geminicoccaceae bacterium]
MTLVLRFVFLLLFVPLLSTCGQLARTHELIAEGSQSDLPAPENDFLERDCDAGNAEACLELGAAYASGIGRAQDQRKAFSLFKRACSAGVPHACGALGEAYANGSGVVKDETKAVTFLRQACDANDIDACFNLAVIYDEGPSIGDAASLYQRACEERLAEACYALGMRYGGDDLFALFANSPSSYEIARSYFQQACDAGLDKGCDAVLTSLRNLETSKRIRAQRVGASMQACADGNASACYELALAFSLGRGVEKNDEIAFRLNSQACNSGELRGCVSLGLAHLDGTAAEADPMVGLRILSEACDSGEGSGCFYLGLSYEKGLGIERNANKAIAMFQKACDVGDVQTCGMSRSRMKNLKER